MLEGVLKMSHLSLSKSLTIISAALENARSKDFNPMSIVVVDKAGQIIASVREDNASQLRMDIAAGKACSAIGMGANTRILTEKAAKMPAFFNAIASQSQQPFVPQTGGVLIKNADDEVIGAAGASGGTGDQDEEILLFGIQAASLFAQ